MNEDNPLEDPIGGLSGDKAGAERETSAMIKKRVDQARDIQIERLRKYGILTNSEIPAGLIKKICQPERESMELLGEIFEKTKMSARAHDRILKVSRTIADMEGSVAVKPVHISEAVQYRVFDRVKSEVD